MVDFSVVPLVAISEETKSLIGNLLNTPQVVQETSTGLFRDWRGLAQVCNIPEETINAKTLNSNGFHDVLNILLETESLTLKNFKDALEKIERDDVIQKAAASLEKDAEAYLKVLQSFLVENLTENGLAKEHDLCKITEVLTIENNADQAPENSKKSQSEAKDNDLCKRDAENLVETEDFAEKSVSREKDVDKQLENLKESSSPEVENGTCQKVEILSMEAKQSDCCKNKAEKCPENLENIETGSEENEVCKKAETPTTESVPEKNLESLEKSKDLLEQNGISNQSKKTTIDDILRPDREEKIKPFDAFLLYADEDKDFAMEVVNKLEKKNKFKLCLKERDLVPGVSLTDPKIFQLISERCNKLIAIMSPQFLISPANDLFLNFVKASESDEFLEKKIVPCIYQNCELPSQLNYFTKIDYESDCIYFWAKLAKVFNNWQ